MSADSVAISARNSLKSLYKNESKPWLVLGKGPSLSKFDEINPDDYNIAGLNHVMGTQKVDLGHAIDIEVIKDLGDDVYNNCKHLVMPWIPHRKFRPGSKNLKELVSEIEVLERMSSENRLLFYDLCTANLKAEDFEPITVRFFSTEALLTLLGECEFKNIRTLGIDGGSNYDPKFDHLADKVRLANGVASFDAQFIQFPEIINKYELEFGPLDQEIPVPIYVGSSKNEWLSTKVLEYSIKKRSSLAVKFIPLHSIPREYTRPARSECQPRTPFSFHRLLIPELKKYYGRAIYLDSDMLVLKDIRKLWLGSKDPSFYNADINCVRAKTEDQKNSKFSVMVLNCEKLKWKIEEIMKDLDRKEYTYEELMHEMIIANDIQDSIPPEWNTLDNYERGVTGLIHFTNMNTQPWLKANHPCAEVWINHLREAIQDNFISEEDIVLQVELGNVRPGILNELGFSSSRNDENFVPPHLKSTNDAQVDDPGHNKSKSLKDRITGFFGK